MCWRGNERHMNTDFGGCVEGKGEKNNTVIKHGVSYTGSKSFSGGLSFGQKLPQLLTSLGKVKSVFNLQIFITNGVI